MKKVKSLKINNSYRLLIFILFSILIFGKAVNKNNGIKNINQRKETVEVEIIQENETESENDYDEDEQSEKDNEKLIYLDKIIDEKEVKAKKQSKLERAINKLDKKINPVLRFYVPMSYGDWYLIKTTSRKEAEYKNIKYIFNQEESGYKINKMYYDSLKNIWNEDKERAWIKETKGKVYLETQQSRFKAYKNEVVYFDSEYKYMIIKFQNDNILRVFSRYSDGKIRLTGEEKEKYEKIINENQDLRDVAYNSKLKSPDKERAEIEKAEQEKRAKKIEERLNQNLESYFQID